MNNRHRVWLLERQVDSQRRRLAVVGWTIALLSLVGALLAWFA